MQGRRIAQAAGPVYQTNAYRPTLIQSREGFSEISVSSVSDRRRGAIARGIWLKSFGQVGILLRATAQKATGIKARIHDLRHHANTVMVESGTPIPTLKSITGHMTQEMVEHYTHVRDEAKRKAVDALDAANGGLIQ